MKRFALSVLVLAASTITTFNAYAAGNSKCTDVAINMTFVATNIAPAAIMNSEPSKPYSALIRYCSGTHDATMNTAADNPLNFKFTAPVSGSLIQGTAPSFAGGPAFNTQAFMNIRNLTGYTLVQPGVAASYYTRFAGNFMGPDGNTYRYVSLPDDSTCPLPGNCAPNLEVTVVDPSQNQPQEAGWVFVTYTPRDTTRPWSPTNADIWLVDGEFVSPIDSVVQRLTLFLVPKKGPYVHSGQYSMPFKVLITALAPLP